MKKPILVSMIMALILLTGIFFAPSHAQDSAKEEKPTFYHLVPGTYVNGWPRFTIHYPKDWVEWSGNFIGGEVFRVGPPARARFTILQVFIYPLPYSLDKFADYMAWVCKTAGYTEVTVVSDKPSQFRDGTPAREVELQMVISGEPTNIVNLATKKGDLLIYVDVATQTGKVREDLKAILYSVDFQPGKDEPVKLPADVQEFLEKYCSDIVSHDLAKVMTHFSDRFLLSGIKKGEMERVWRQRISPVMSFEVGVTDFILAGDKAYLTGFVNLNAGKGQLLLISIIKENGEWKWYGNQRDISR